MQIPVRNCRLRHENGKTIIDATPEPIYVRGRDDQWFPIPEEGQEAEDMHRKFTLPRARGRVVLDGIKSLDEIDILGRNPAIKQAEEQAGIQYPRECIWVEGADSGGTVILPGNCDVIYTIEDYDNPVIAIVPEGGDTLPYWEKVGDEVHVHVAHFSGVAGAQSAPIEVATLADLDNIRNDTSGYYQLVADIDASGVNWTPIPPFTGVVDGDGHAISNLFINLPTTNNVGLFALVAGTAQIENLKITNPNITGQAHVGGMAGAIRQNATVVNCAVEGGHIVSTNAGAFTSYVGGFSGSINSFQGTGVTVTECYSTANVTGNTLTGGFVGGITNANNILTHCYTTGAITTPASSNVGGFTANAHGSTVATGCYWDINTSGMTTSPIGEGKTTAQMKQQATYVGWDFDTVWDINPNINGGYPFLRGFGGDVEPSPPPEIVVESWTHDKISAQPGFDETEVMFVPDQDLVEWVARANGDDYATGPLVGSGTTLQQGQAGYFTVRYDELPYGDKVYKISVYGKNADGVWTE